MSCKRNHLALAIGALLSAGIANTAFAQTAEPAATSADTTTQDPKTMETVTVTGSHIKRCRLPYDSSLHSQRHVDGRGQDFGEIELRAQIGGFVIKGARR